MSRSDLKKGEDAPRASGILLHITSLPSEYGIGDMGPWAYRFADFLAETGQSLWQILPLVATDPACGNSPYSSPSAFAGNPLMISPDLLVEDRLLTRQEADSLKGAPAGRIDYARTTDTKRRALDLALPRLGTSGLRQDYDRFCGENAAWLETHAVFTAVKRHMGGLDWGRWPDDLRARKQSALDAAGPAIAQSAERERLTQFLFYRQWTRLRDHCRRRGVRVIGDVPIYVSYDSADAWGNPEIFNLDADGRPVTVAGVPPDFFSKTGQLWGNPLYRWEALKQTGYRWWIDRLRHALALFDVVRIDHFRGFLAYWAVPAGDETAVNGTWVAAPGQDFFARLASSLPGLPLIAEDLGVITPDVRELMEVHHLPGMKVLLFAFGDNNPMHPYLPHCYEPDCVVYTGTHDNNTARGWFDNEAAPADRERLARYLGRSVPAERVAWELVRLAMMSVARMAVFPMQDILGLGEDSRMNLPSMADGNWGWRLTPDQMAGAPARELLAITETYGRKPGPAAG
ncbi:MAG: 4-alpha-glucanotransferase [bacterium]